MKRVFIIGKYKRRDWPNNAWQEVHMVNGRLSIAVYNNFKKKFVRFKLSDLPADAQLRLG
jgi:hypothetical protein